MNPVTILLFAATAMLAVGWWLKRSLPPESMMRAYSEGESKAIRRAVVNPFGELDRIRQEDMQVLHLCQRRWRIGYVLLVLIALIAITTRQVWRIEHAGGGQLASTTHLARSDSAPANRPPTEIDLLPAYVDAELKGLKVAHLSEDTPWFRGGLRKGDVIVRLGDADLTTPDSLGDAWARLHDPGRWPVEIKIMRGGQVSSIEIVSRPLE